MQAIAHRIWRNEFSPSVWMDGEPTETEARMELEGCHKIERAYAAACPADALERLLALEPNADNLKRWQELKAEPLRKLEIEHVDNSFYWAWMTDADGNLHQVGPQLDHPYELADWCERNGFAWEVIGATGDPLVELAAWRAGK